MPVTVSETAGSIRLAGVVEANGYRQVVVAPLASGRVTRVPVMLGDQVAMNAPVVEIYSPELADAQTRFLSMRAEFQAVEQEIARTERLVEIGAASRQELERIHAEHVRHRTELESARARLQLLGMTPQTIEAMASGGTGRGNCRLSPAPIAGVRYSSRRQPRHQRRFSNAADHPRGSLDRLGRRRSLRARLLIGVGREPGRCDDHCFS